jgi:hypothetical protein
MSGDGGLVIAELHCHPIKSCGGIRLQTAVLTPSGLLFDRRWVVVKATTGRFLTQRQVPQMCLVATAMDPAGVLQGDDPAAHPGAALVLAAPGMPPLRVPLVPAAPRPLVTASVWEATSMQGYDEGEAAAEWFSTFLGQPARLVRYAGDDHPAAAAAAPLAADPTRRHANREFAPEGHEVAFADGFPLLVASAASLDDLNARMAAAVPMDRFRPNVVLSGGAAWAEDAWDTVRVGPAELLAVKPCSRCKIPSVDQATAEVGEEPTATLTALRSGAALGWAAPPAFKVAIFFGVNMCAVSVGEGVLRVGQGAEVLSTREGPPQPQPRK